MIAQCSGTHLRVTFEFFVFTQRNQKNQNQNLKSKDFQGICRNPTSIVMFSKWPWQCRVNTAVIRPPKRNLISSTLMYIPHHIHASLSHWYKPQVFHEISSNLQDRFSSYDSKFICSLEIVIKKVIFFLEFQHIPTEKNRNETPSFHNHPPNVCAVWSNVSDLVYGPFLQVLNSIDSFSIMTYFHQSLCPE